MKKSTIKAINKYVKKISMSVCDYDQNLSDIQEEMKTHIMDKTNELIDQNINEEEALEQAFLDFGDMNSIDKEFGPFTPKFKFNNLLKASLFGYIFSAFLLLFTCIFIRFCNENFIAIHHLNIKSIANCSTLLINIFSLSFIIWQFINYVKSKSIIILKKCLLPDILALLQFAVTYIMYYGFGLRGPFLYSIYYMLIFSICIIFVLTFRKNILER